MIDAPTLAGADSARPTPDIALLEDDIGRVADARRLADATTKRIAAAAPLLAT